jgi:hypothetical protein
MNVRKCSSELGICGRFPRCFYIRVIKATRCSALASSRIAPHIRIPDLFCTSCAKNLFMLMCGRSENVRKCSSELGICGRFPRCFNHIISEILQEFTLKGGGGKGKGRRELPAAGHQPVRVQPAVNTGSAGNCTPDPQQNFLQDSWGICERFSQDSRGIAS